MGLMKMIRRLLGQGETTAQRPAATTTAPRTPLRVTEDEPEPVVREVSATELRASLAGAAPPVVLDVREAYEWRQVRLADALHIPMNDLPARVGELDPSRPVIVMCAHGMRSYSVAAWLNDQGYDAASLRGGISQWAGEGGPVETGEDLRSALT
jgi:rhodanese-related sulfurtransferase